MPAERPSGDLGHKLREARERRGASLRQIASSTKIAVGVLEALERNDVSRLPGGIFGRAFVRSFATEVGLDPEETIQEFIAQFPHDGVAIGHTPSDQTDNNDAIESDRRVASTVLRLMALSIPIAILVVYFSSARRGSKPAAAEQPAPAADVRSAAGAPARDGLTVVLSARGPCRVSAIVDGVEQIERLLQAGDQRILRVRRELVLTADDAGAIEMTVNGVAAKPLGKSGDAMTARLDPANFRRYLLSP